nr:hypothetical protein [Roseitalea porphyridii]
MSGENATVDHDALERLIADVTASGGAEMANAQPFIEQLTAGAGNGGGRRRQAGIERAIKAEPVSLDDHLDHRALPLTPEAGTDAKIEPLGLNGPALAQLLACLGIKTAQLCGLQPPGQRQAEQFDRSQLGRRSLMMAPSGAQTIEIGIVELCDEGAQRIGVVMRPHGVTAIR